MEVTDDASMVEGVNNIVKAQGRLEVLINNAGYGSYGTIEEVDMKEAKRQCVRVPHASEDLFTISISQ
jgi:short-subunit dehydrogenase